MTSVTLPTRPESLELDLARSAIIVLDLFQEYWPVLVRDGTMQAGPLATHEATIFNVESFFGWTLTAQELRGALAEPNP